MHEPLDELYLRWLYSQVGSVRTRIRAKKYWTLLTQLYKTEFIWIVPNDDNRCMDGIALREEFLQDSDIRRADPNWLALGCSFLEMLIGLSRRLSFEAEGETATWFWQMIHNIELDGLNDAAEFSTEGVSDKLNQVIWRQYNYDGTGGLFPLRQPDRDQRQVELWYQLNAYLLENG